MKDVGRKKFGVGAGAGKGWRELRAGAGKILGEFRVGAEKSSSLGGNCGWDCVWKQGWEELGLGRFWENLGLELLLGMEWELESELR